MVRKRKGGCLFVVVSFSRRTYVRDFAAGGWVHHKSICVWYGTVQYAARVFVYLFLMDFSYFSSCFSWARLFRGENAF